MKQLFAKLKLIRRQFKMLKAIEIMQDEIEILFKENKNDNAKILFDISEKVMDYYSETIHK